MAIIDRNTIKSWYETDDYPTQAQFHSWIESFYHKSEDSYIDSHIENADLHFLETSINHSNIGSIGSNSHSAIDAHIADNGIHGGGGGGSSILNEYYTTITSSVGGINWEGASGLYSAIIGSTIHGLTTMSVSSTPKFKFSAFHSSTSFFEEITPASVKVNAGGSIYVEMDVYDDLYVHIIAEG